MYTPAISRVLSDPATSSWLEDAIRSALHRDPLVSLQEAERFLTLMQERADVFQKHEKQKMEF